MSDEVCTVCHKTIFTMAFKGTGYCGADCTRTASTAPDPEVPLSEPECST